MLVVPITSTSIFQEEFMEIKNNIRTQKAHVVLSTTMKILWQGKPIKIL